MHPHFLRISFFTAFLFLLASCGGEADGNFSSQQVASNTNDSGKGPDKIESLDDQPVAHTDTINPGNLSPVSPNQPTITAGDGPPDMSTSAGTVFSYKVTETKDSLGNSLGWGYMIYTDNKPWISQKFLPAISGNKACRTEADAKKLAELVVQRAKKMQSFPTISTHDLDSLKIKY